MNILFPFKLYLSILQLEEYKVLRFISWIFKHPFTRAIAEKKSVKYTSKLKLIIYLSIFWFFVIVSLAYFAFENSFLFVFIVSILLVQPYILLVLATLTILPYELINKNLVISKTRGKISRLKKLKVIGITGSFGKTTTKEFLYQILSTKYSVLKTPESFNTIFGIAKVVDYELDSKYEYFICEMAAYKIGEIKTLTRMVPPDIGVLTGITKQHLERFGSLENTIKAKFELYDAIKDANKFVFNVGNENILKEVQTRRINPSWSYSTKSAAIVQLNKVAFGKNGSTLEISVNKNQHILKTKLFGYGNIENLLAATCTALLCGMTIDEVKKAVADIKPTANRFELVSTAKASIVNNTYSSNVASFREMLRTAKVVKGKKVLVTPGLVELGNESLQIHSQLGRDCRDIFQKIVLVGNNLRTKALAEGIDKNTTVEFIDDNRKSYFEKIETLKENFDWIFLENDITQNY